MHMIPANKLLLCDFIAVWSIGTEQQVGKVFNLCCGTNKFLEKLQLKRNQQAIKLIRELAGNLRVTDLALEPCVHHPVWTESLPPDQEFNLAGNHFEKKKKRKKKCHPSRFYHCGSLLVVLPAIIANPLRRSAAFLASFIKIARDQVLSLGFLPI